MKNGVVLKFLEETMRVLREKFIIDHGRNPGPGDEVDIPDEVMNTLVVKHMMLTLPVCIQEIGAEGRITEEDALRCALLLRKTEDPERFFNLLIDMINCWEAGGEYWKRDIEGEKTAGRKSGL